MQKKETIKNLIAEMKEASGMSANDFAISIKMSKAHFSNLMNDKFELISDKVWRTLADLCGLKQKEWELAETAAFTTTMPLLADAQEYGNVYVIINHAGSGKSVTCDHYTRNNQDVFMVTCEEGMSKRDFLNEILTKMGVTPNGMTTYQMLGEVVRACLRRDRPLIIMDEWEKLDDKVRYYFITLYNKLEDKCGFIISSTYRLKYEIERGVKRGKRGYEELYSRFGCRFVLIPKLTNSDVAKICRQNGIENDAEISKIATNSIVDIDNTNRYDGRRLKKLAQNLKRKEAGND